MKNGLRPWIAGQPEKRAALVVASLSLILVVVAFAWPLIGHEQTTSAAVETARQTVPAHKAEPVSQPMPPKQTEEAKPPAPAKQTVSKTAVPAPAPKPVTKSPVPPTPQKESLTKGFYIQLGAFKEKQRAASLAKRLSKSWHTHVVDRPNSLHAVWVGPYKSSTLAKQDQARISKAEKINGFITRH